MSMPDQMTMATRSRNPVLVESTRETLKLLTGWISIREISEARGVRPCVVRACLKWLHGMGAVQRRRHDFGKLNRGGLTWCYQYRRTPMGTLMMAPKARVEKVRPRPAQLPSYGVDWNFRSTSVE